MNRRSSVGDSLLVDGCADAIFHHVEEPLEDLRNRVVRDGFHDLGDLLLRGSHEYLGIRA